jgi:sugar fermentation stimulation protein A
MDKRGFLSLSSPPFLCYFVGINSRKRLFMRFNTPLLPGTLIKRYKRFLADIKTAEGDSITAHCPNSGSMKGLNAPGIPVWYSISDNPDRKLPYTLELVEVEGTCVGINTNYPNRIAHNAIQSRSIPELAGYTVLKQEVKISPTSRLDFALQSSTHTAYLEVKNVTLKEGMALYFPDAVTSRGTKHLLDLIRLHEQGHPAFMLYIAQRADAHVFSIEKNIDPLYFKQVKEAMDAGVQMLAYSCTVSPDGIQLAHSLRIQI